MSFLRQLLNAIARSHVAKLAPSTDAPQETIEHHGALRPFVGLDEPPRGEDRAPPTLDLQVEGARLPAHFDPPEMERAQLRAAERAEAIAEDAILADFMTMSVNDQLKLIETELAKLSPEEQRHVSGLLAAELDKPFLPLPGPQTDAWASQADVVLYGGAAGGGKSKLLLGCAATDHRRALIVRRQSTELDGLISESREMLSGRAELNKVEKEWTFPDGRSLKFGGMKDADDWRTYAGRARDFIGFDEAAEFLEEQVASILGWMRSTSPGQRCRCILASNPPRGAEGAWLITWFAPWLDPQFLDIAVPGEIRWSIRVGDDVIWNDPATGERLGPGSVEIEGETYTPESRTFVPAKLDDNPFLARTTYRARLQNMPEPLRSQLLHGDFLAGREDDAWQVIPSDWIMAARQRWTVDGGQNKRMTAIGVDVAQGGADETVLSARHENWFAPLKAEKGVNTKDGPAVAGLVFMAMRDGCEILIDLGGGWGAEAYGHLKQQDINVSGLLSQQPSMAKTFDGKASFLNIRAEMWWKFREALDPMKGSSIALPPDPNLVADLQAPRWRMRPGGTIIQIESKDDIKKRLGRSPDRGDAVVQSWHGGQTPRASRRPETLQQTANVGHAAAKRAVASMGTRQATANRGYSNRR